MTQVTPPGRPLNLGNILWPLLLIGLGCLLLRMSHRSFETLAWGGGAIALGSLLLLADLVIRFYFGTSPAKAARTTDERYQKLYGGLHERRLAAEGEIAASRLNVAFYEVATAEFEAAGFRRLPDYVNITIQNAGLGTRAVLRPFVSDDNSIIGAAYDVRFKRKIRILRRMKGKSRDFRTLELQTELDDQTFASTSTATNAALTSETPGVSRRYLPRGSALRELLTAHQQHVANLLRDKPDVAAVRLENLDEIFASHDRAQLLKIRYRNSPAFNPLDEIQRIAGKPLTEQQRAYAIQAASLHAKRVGATIAEIAPLPPRRPE